MNSDVARIVDRVLLCGLDLKERLERGDKLDVAVEQTQLRSLLKSESEARRWPDYGGDHPMAGTTIGGERAHGFQGIRYALVCWLDEMFTLDPLWASKWQEEALEPEMYHTRLRAEQFWEQARRAEARPNTDALEAYFLCAVLGFRGKYAGAPEKLRAWTDSVEPRITAGFDRGYDLPSAKMPPCNVPPLVGRDKMKKLLLAGAILAGVFLVLAAFVLVTVLHR
jgi:type VI secretion system protein ImpK